MHVVLNPAVLPGENVAAVYTGFVHSVGELNGTYVFKYTIHGTLNGMPVNLSASSAPIQMTG
jgi:ABC-type molybdate transport system permease subunit